ncbi:glycosyltransferase [Modestobacter excelsi]|uniref:glycosyltransferase n=1 Tax=Modestobacter excelsi TaxID=2213161 RepID=UPI001C20CC7B|nr:glycosyltransferase family 2 protein [Modestobacter excelsi]
MDLGTGTARAVPAVTSFECAPEGVHALIWLHGVPVAELTLPGDPAELLPQLPELARRSSEAAVREHQVQHTVEETAVSCAQRSPCESEKAWRARADGSLLTVAVCTRDRPEDLARCLEALALLTLDVEVLVIDNDPEGDWTRTVVGHHPRARYVLEPRRGTAWARNRALLEARTPLVAFVDDDVQVQPRWAEALIMAFDANPDADAVTGLVSPTELATRAQVVFEAAGGFGRGYRQRRLQPSSADPREAARAVYHIGAMGTGANMAFHRERLIAIGGFDPALGPGTPTRGGEDQEALSRLLATGGLIVYEPAAAVRHRHRRTMDELRDQRRADGAGSASLLIGASRKLGAAHHRQWSFLAIRWFLKSAAWTVAASVLRPSARPMSLVRSNLSGWIQALARDPYRRAVEQILRQADGHPDEPLLAPLPLALKRR